MKLAKEILAIAKAVAAISEEDIAIIWRECAAKAIDFGDIGTPKVKITNSKSYYGLFQYPRNSNFYKDFDKSILFISKSNLEAQQLITLTEVVQHEFTHCIMWKEYPKEKESHGPIFIKTHQSIFHSPPLLKID